VNDEVKIKSGPFLSSTGIVQEIDPERGELKVNVTIFGRDVLTTIGIYEVEKVVPEETESAPII
ncbi:MAG: KOW motif-containing protein, partial [Kiritimatiellae bacterium]|nr:KOW motif-containing protein [Kiritimatiellia bacterium]